MAVNMFPGEKLELLDVSKLRKCRSLPPSEMAIFTEKYAQCAETNEN